MRPRGLPSRMPSQDSSKAGAATLAATFINGSPPDGQPRTPGDRPRARASGPAGRGGAARHAGLAGYGPAAAEQPALTSLAGRVRRRPGDRQADHRGSRCPRPVRTGGHRAAAGPAGTTVCCACWCAKSVPEPVRSQAETAYRATWRSITGADPGGQLADACARWLIPGDALVERARRGPPGYLTQLPHKDWSWGTATARQRLLHPLTAVTAVAANHPRVASLPQRS